MAVNICTCIALDHVAMGLFWIGLAVDCLYWQGFGLFRIGMAVDRLSGHGC